MRGRVLPGHPRQPPALDAGGKLDHPLARHPYPPHLPFRPPGATPHHPAHDAPPVPPPLRDHGIPARLPAPRGTPGGMAQLLAPAGVRLYNPAFDLTPADLIAGIITEKGLIQPVNAATIRKFINVSV